MRSLALAGLALFAPIATSLSASDIPADTPVAQLISSATAALAQGKAQDALIYFDVAVARDPQNYLTIFRRGAAYLSLGRSSQASHDFDKVLAIKPTFEGALVQRAKLRSRSGLWDDAKTDYKAAGKQASPEWAELEEAQGAAKLSADAQKAGDWAACATQADVAIRVAAANLDLRRRRATCRFEKGEIVEGISDLQQLAQLSSSADIYQQISATCFFGLDEADRGLTQVKNCLMSDPDSKACGKLFRREKAINKRRKKIDELFNQSHWNSAIKLLVGSGDEQGLVSEAKQETAELRGQGLIPKAASGGLAQALIGMTCQAYTEIDQLRKAKPYCDEALAAEPHNLAGLVHRATREIGEDLFEEAIRTLKTAEETHGGSQKLQELQQKAQTLLRRSKQKDYYKVLGVQRDADERDIKRAWRKLSVQHHPDKAARQGISQEEAQKKMAAINEAYEVLSDPELRQRFDHGDDPNDNSRQQGNPFQGSPFGPGGQAFFQQGGGQHFKFQQAGFDFQNFPGGFQFG